MLTELSIQNVALITKLALEFGSGFNVLTGETGAGKSIIVDSLSFALGARADRDLIKSGADRAFVQAVFDITSNEAVCASAEELGLDVSDSMLAISRELRDNGRGMCRMNGVVFPLSVIKSITSHLLDIHGQHEHQALINPERHIGFLDGFGGSEIKAMKNDIASLYADRQRLSSLYKKITGEMGERERRIDVLEHQVKEIFAIKPRRDEEEKLEKRARFYADAEKIEKSVEEAYELVASDDERSVGAYEQLNSAIHTLETIADSDERIEKLLPQLRDAYYTVQDIGYELRDLKESLDFDPETADKVYTRLDRIRKLERKYGETLNDVIDFGEKAKSELEELRAMNMSADDVKAELVKADTEYLTAAKELSRKRADTARMLEKEVICQLKDLGMASTRFEVSIRESDPSADGMDDVEFMISANAGQPLKPLAAVASGGELSRIMLALKVISIDSGDVESMVFDEIDTGVSGNMAQAVGEKIKLIANNHQVLCVTHLPQIAALGDTHFMVEKFSDGESTGSTVTKLDDEGRINEISRLIGDGEISRTAREHARHLLGLDAKA